MENELKTLQDLNLMDRFLFAEAMEDEIVSRNFLEIIFNGQVPLLSHVETEKELRTSPLLRSVRLDVFFMDDRKTVYAAEMQKKNTRNLPKRSRYYQSLLDSSLLEPGVIDYNLLNDSCMIMITPFDLFGYSRYQYTFDMACREVPELKLDDGGVRIFLNTKGTVTDKVSPELIEFLHYIERTDQKTCNQCKSPRIKAIHERVKLIKSSEEIGVRWMQLWEEKLLERKEAEESGEKRGEKRLADLIKLLLQDNRQDLISKAASDRLIREKLFKEYQLK